ncbi:alpha-beta hydrolase superfamily lysophospholipase [Rhodococcus sp. OK519]|uniref:alpha/beta hydrolase n=1 Tax=Rhodococcus sp. OK519 TaxID=2135729 RepID=UPI000D3396E9|nr:alpha-beta hydrolase superfamily lysophospholipase [Rhodococcus sp. OK519]
MLEVIDRGRSTSRHPTPVLCVHGAWHGAWCWDEHFLEYFVARGYRAVAVSLRGHGGSRTSKPLHSLSVADYVDDVRKVADRLPSGPILLGHSMGGFVVQKYLESNTAPAAVLLASTPPRGASRSLVRRARVHPWLYVKAAVTGRSLHTVSLPAVAREAFFPAGMSDILVTRYASRLTEESRRSVLDTLFLDLPRPERVTAPILVLGGSDDRVFSPAEIHATARAYRTTAEILPHTTHNMMLGTQWRPVAEHIAMWLDARGL